MFSLSPSSRTHSMRTQASRVVPRAVAARDMPDSQRSPDRSSPAPTASKAIQKKTKDGQLRRRTSETSLSGSFVKGDVKFEDAV